MGSVKVSRRGRWNPSSIARGWLELAAGAGLMVYLYAVTGMGQASKPDKASHPHAQLEAFDLEAQVWSVAASSTGMHLAGATIAGDVWLADLRTGGSFRVRSGGQRSVRSVAFSPDGQILAVAGSEPAVRLWNVAIANEREPIEFGEAEARCLTFSPDGRYLAVGGHTGSLKIWDWKKRERICELGSHPGSINSVAFSPDASLLYSGDTSGFVRIWHVATGRQRVGFRAHGPGMGGVVALAVSPDGRLIATAGFLEPQVRLWDAARGAPNGSLPAAAEGVYALAFSPTQPLLAIARGDGAAALWDFKAAAERCAVRATDKPLESVVFSSDGKRIATGSSDGTVRLWEISRALENAPSATNARSIRLRSPD
jgi:WD40 repeat protein